MFEDDCGKSEEKSSMTSKNHLQATRSRAEKSVDDTLLLHGIDLQ